MASGASQGEPLKVVESCLRHHIGRAAGLWVARISGITPNEPTLLPANGLRMGKSPLERYKNKG